MKLLMDSVLPFLLVVVTIFIPVIFMFFSMFKSINEFYNLKKVRTELKGTDIKSSNFIIFTILALLIVISYFFDNDTKSEIFVPCFMLFNGYFFYSISLKKIRYMLMDERERFLLYKITAWAGYIFAAELYLAMLKNEVVVEIIKQDGSSWLFLFLYLFNVSLVAFFIFRKNEKENKLTQEESV